MRDPRSCLATGRPLATSAPVQPTWTDYLSDPGLIHSIMQADTAG
jgi:hypothetical protein